MWTFLLCWAALAADAPEISRSTGQPGGFVVLWPRVVPATTDPALAQLAGALQARLRALTQGVAPSAPLDVRPAPERVCPRQGCQGAAIGALLYHQQGMCVAVLSVSPPGPSAAQISPWGGVVDLRARSVPFREPPESQVAVRDFVPCDQILAATAASDTAVADAIRAVAGR